MVQKGLVGFFESFLAKESLFKNKKVLQSAYVPETIIHRDDQINQMAAVLAPALRLEKPSNLFMYGRTGTGKTVSTRYTISQLKEVSIQKNIPLSIFYVNCKLKKIADTEYRLIAQLSREFGKAVPATGLPTEEIYKIFFDAIDDKKQTILLVLDEIDQLVKKAGDEILYNLTRINSELKNAQISLVGISNDITFADNLDPRVKSSLSEEEIVFPPYNAVQLQHILKRRARLAFKQNVIKEGVIEKCAAYAAREHGDARRALELLRVAGEIAEREGKKQVTMTHIDKAEEKIEHDKIIDVVSTQPRQCQAVLYSILMKLSGNTKSVFTGDVYDLYREISKQAGLRPLTQRRLSDVVGELDMLGIINARIISKGRYGRTREISCSMPASTIPKVKSILQDSLNI